jgi:hypothetical protein
MNNQWPGEHISDFQTADKAVVEVLPMPRDEDLVLPAVSPGQLKTSDELYLPYEDR